MNVTIIGAGNMGRAIGSRLIGGGHSVTYISKNPADAEKAAMDLQSMAKSGTRVDSASLENVKLGDVVILAVWHGTNIELVKQLGKRLAGKVVVDIANPVNATYDGLATLPGTSAAEEVAKAASAGVNVVKAFNTTFAGTLKTGQVDGQILDVFIAGDDAGAKKMVSQLVSDGGMRPVDIGPLSRSQQIEGMQLLQIVVQGALGTNWGSTVKILG
jgi:8-hydroxy-5-deazaflavin:NADPH oxidoreductase